LRRKKRNEKKENTKITIGKKKIEKKEESKMQKKTKK
jgi:hypothetical protein